MKWKNNCWRTDKHSISEEIYPRLDVMILAQFVLKWLSGALFWHWEFMAAMQRRFTASSGEALAMLALPFLGRMATTSIETKKFCDSWILLSTVVLAVVSQNHFVTLAVEANKGGNVLWWVTLTVLALRTRRWPTARSGAIEEVVMSSFSGQSLVTKANNVIGAVVMLLCREGHLSFRWAVVATNTVRDLFDFDCD